MHLHRAAVAATTYAGSTAGHETGDYLVQSDSCARIKQQHTPQGRRGLAIHVVTYAATLYATRAAAYRVAGLRVSPLANAAGVAAEAVLHGVIDDGRLLRKFADATGKRGFHDVNAGGINGRALMDQAAHKGAQIPIGVAVTTAVDAWLRRR